MKELELNEELLVELQDYIRAMMLSENTYRTYSYALSRLFKDNKTISQDNINKILSKKNKRGQYVYLNPNKRAIFKLINNYCLSKSIKFSIVIPKVNKKERILTDIPTIDEIRSIVKGVPYPYNLMLRVIYNFGAGLRINEFVRLTWKSSSINWAEWLNNRKDTKCLIKESKRGKSRYVTVPNDLMEDLYKYAKETVGLNEYRLPNSNRFIFDFDKGLFRTDLFIVDREKWQIEYVRFVQRWMDYHILRKYCEKIIGRKIHIHQFRNSRASYLYNYENMPIEVIQELLGHKNIETTRIYVKISFGKIIKSMEGTQSI